jgi:uncharacterized membrane-anchored protein YjiN (DUF445 family)
MTTPPFGAPDVWQAQQVPSPSRSALSSLVGGFGDTLAKRAALRRMKRLALALLIVAAAVYVLTYLADDGEHGWVGFVRAASEAGIVGGLADWFAVTALFRHPLGLPIPHTALIPTRKDALAGTLGEFVTGNFLTGDNVRKHLHDGGYVLRAGRSLASHGLSPALSRRVFESVADALEAVKPEILSQLVLEVARRDARQRSYAALLGSLLEDVRRGGAYRPLLDVVLPYARRVLEEDRDVVRPQVKEMIEGFGFFAWLLATDKAIDKLLDSAGKWLQQLEEDPRHPARLVLDDRLREFAADLQSDTELAHGVDGFLRTQLDDPRTAEWGRRLAQGALGSLVTALRDPAGEIATRLAVAVTDLGRRIERDEQFRARIESATESIAAYLVEHYGQEFTSLVEKTIKGWDGADAADKIELAAGRDLQFIRINGTVVGALAGTALHTGFVLLS